MSSLMAFLLMQYVVSVKAGLVNHVQGQVNVAEMEMVLPGHAVRTGANGYAEVLLTPGSFLRLGENSQTVLEGVEFNDLHLVVLSGPAEIEVVEISGNTPIQVTTGNLEMAITSPGVYRFESGTATVIQGKLETGDRRLTYEKGWQVFFEGSYYRARKKASLPLTGLEVYSQTRSELIARANYNMAAALQPSYGQYESWIYAPFIGMYTYIPSHGFRSPYGYLYYAPRRANSPGNGPRPSGSSTGTASNSGGSNSGSNSGSGNGNSQPSIGEGGGAAPVTIATPSGQSSSPAVYIESKNSPVNQ